MKTRNDQNKSKVKSEIPASVVIERWLPSPRFCPLPGQPSLVSPLTGSSPSLLFSLSYFTFLPVHSPQSCSLLLPPPSLSLSLSLSLSRCLFIIPPHRHLSLPLPFFTDKCREEGEGEGNLHHKESKTRVLQVKKRASQIETGYPSV